MRFRLKPDNASFIEWKDEWNLKFDDKASSLQVSSSPAFSSFD
jgi:hypothetical protein